MSSSDTRPVVVGVDGAPGSAGALRYGVTEAGRRGVALHLVHVLPTYPPMAPLAPVPVSELRSIGSSVLERASATARDLATQLEVSTGSPSARGPVASSRRRPTPSSWS